MVFLREFTGMILGALDDWRALSVLCVLLGVLVWAQAMRERDAHKAVRDHKSDFEPILGGSPLSFLTVPLFRALRLVCVDLLSKHACFVAATGWMVHLHVDKLSGWGVVSAVSLVVIHLLSWVNWIFPDQRARFLDAVIEVIRAVPTWWAKAGTTTTLTTETTGTPLAGAPPTGGKP